MERLNYFSSKISDCDNTWKECVLAEDVNHAFKSIMIVNDDSSNELQIMLNDTDNDILYIPANEGVALDKEVYRIFYCASAGNPAFRVVCD